MKTGIFLLAALFLMVSCVDINQKKQLKQIDDMAASIDSLTTVLKDNDLPNATVMSDSIKEIEGRFKKYYVPDTIDLEVHVELNDLKQSRKTLAHLEKDHSNFTLGCKEMKESLRQLRYDIENSDGARKSYSEYISFESNKLRDLTRLITDYVDQKDLSAERYNRLYAKWNDFSLELKNNKK